MGYMPKNATYYTWIVVFAMAMIMPDEDDVQFLISFNDITSQKNLVYTILSPQEKSKCFKCWSQVMDVRKFRKPWT